jgi:hypothetical protein
VRKVQKVKAMVDLVGIEGQDQGVAVRRRNLAHVRMSVANALGNNI